MLGGYWMIDVKSREEAIAWAKSCPASENEIIEIRQVQEMADFSEEVQQAARRLRRTAEGKRTRRGESSCSEGSARLVELPPIRQPHGRESQ